MAIQSSSAAFPKLSPVTLLVTTLKIARLAPRGCLVRVRSGTDSNSPRERWFAVGIYFQKLAEAAVCNLPQIEPSDIVFARRKLRRAEIEALALRRGQVVQCSVGDEVETSVANHALSIARREKSRRAANAAQYWPNPQTNSRSPRRGKE
jgi:hypothetical protein